MADEPYQTIVVVEDDSGIRDVLQIILGNAGYNTIFYTDGEAFLKNDEGVASLYILDKQLPGVDGIQLCRHLRSQPTTEQIPIIIFSASPLVREASKAAGATAFIEKPFKVKDFLTVTEQLIYDTTAK